MPPDADPTQRPNVAAAPETLPTPDEAPPVLVVDLDGTLLRVDVTIEAMTRLLVTRPWRLLVALAFLLRGVAAFKRALHQCIHIDPATLPYREPVLAYLREARQAGRRIILATGADASIASAVADHLGLFDAVIASDGRTSRTGKAKLKAICALTGTSAGGASSGGGDTSGGGGGFEYLGNCAADLPIWRQSRRVLIVKPSPRLRKRIASMTTCDVVVVDAD